MTVLFKWLDSPIQCKRKEKAASSQQLLQLKQTLLLVVAHLYTGHLWNLQFNVATGLEGLRLHAVLTTWRELHANNMLSQPHNDLILAVFHRLV